MQANQSQSDLRLGNHFSIPFTERSPYLCRKLIFRGDRPVGHWSYGSANGGGSLWLQNHAGYTSPDFSLGLDSEEIALRRTAEILKEWDLDPRCPTWIA
jgi:hypothetical protein